MTINVHNNLEVPFNYTGKVIYKDGWLEEYYKNGLLHRTDGPAQIFRQRMEAIFCLEGRAYLDQNLWFLSLSKEEKERAIWNMDEWR